MRPPLELVRIVDGKRYSVATATLLAGDDWWDGHNYERYGRNTFLYRTPGGRYFAVTLTCWQGERDKLVPVLQNDAVSIYENDLPKHYVDYEDAFPGVKIVDA